MNTLIRRNNVKFWLIALAITGAVFSSCNRQPSAAPVSNDYPVMKLKKTDAVWTDRYTVSIKGKQNVEIRPQVSGQIVKICIDEGASIRKGQPLFIIDQVPYKAALETAEANVESAKAKLATARLTMESKQQLYEQQIVSAFDLQTAQNSLREAEAGLAQARAAETNARNDLSYTVIKSPVDGVASMIPYKVGTLVSSSMSVPLTTVSNEDEMYAYFSMTEKQVQDLVLAYGSMKAMLQSMPEIKLQLPGGKEYAHTGRIDAVSGTVDAQTGAVIVRATFPNPEKLLMNGGTATVLIRQRQTGSIVIPQSATFEVQNKRFAYKVVSGKATSTAIEAKAIDGGKSLMVLSGLTEGDVIISEGAGLVREGATVNTSKN